MPTNVEDPSLLQNMIPAPSPEGEVQDAPTALPEETDEDTILRKVDGIRAHSKTYRDQEATTWSTIESQLACEAPSWWSEKEDWQTKVYIAQQFKTSESALSMLKEIIFGSGDFFSVMGIEGTDRAKQEYLRRFINVLLDMGGFHRHNDFVFKEGVDLGSSFMKIAIDPEQDMEKWNGFKFAFVSCKDALIDCASSIVDFEESKFWIHQYYEHVQEVLVSPIYTDDKKDALLDHLQGKPGLNRTDAYINVQGVGAAGGSRFFAIPLEYQTVLFEEVWGWWPVVKKVQVKGQEVEYTALEWKVVTIADEKIVMRNDDNPYDCIPSVRMRVKSRRTSPYGDGFLSKTIDTQDLMNSVVNLGFDSAKIGMLPIARVDSARCPNLASIVLKPLAIWDAPPDAATIENLKTDALRTMLQSLAYLDQVDQDISGVLRQSQGAQSVFANDSETLGQTKLKMAGVEKRFLKVAKEIAEDYIVPLLRKMFKIIQHPQFIDRFQMLANRVLGVDELPDPAQVARLRLQVANTSEVLTPEALQAALHSMPRVKIPRLDLSQLGRIGADFRVISIQNFLQKQEASEKIQKLLEIAAREPQFSMMFKMDKLLERYLQMNDVPDYKELINSMDEIQRMMQTAQSEFGFQPGGAGGGQSQGGQQPQKQIGQSSQQQPPSGQVNVHVNSQPQERQIA